MKKLTLLSALFAFSSSLLTLSAQTGYISTVAGIGGAGGYNGDNIAATNARLDTLSGVAVDKTGNIYIADQNNNRIRKVNTSGIITTIAGTGVSGYSGNNGPATSAQLSLPNGVRVDTLGNVYFTDANNALVRKISTTGIITNIAGIPGIGGYSGDGGAATSAELSYPVGLCLDKQLNVYVADGGDNVIRKITVATGKISTVAGDFALGAGFSGNGGPATSARLNSPTGVAVDRSGNMYIADYLNNVVRVVNTTGTISNFAGSSTAAAGYNGISGLADTTLMTNPTGVSTSNAGNVYISDAGDSFIREVLIATHQMYVVAGNGNDAFSGDGGAAVNASLFYPFDVYPDANNNFYIADLANNRVRKVAATCVVDTSSVAVYNFPECSNSNDGILQAVTNSPFAPYTYSWAPISNTNLQVTGLSAGTYSITITDALGCTETGKYVLTAPAALIAHTANDTICEGSQVTLSSSATGGTGPYTFEWVTGATTDTTTVNPAQISLYSYTIYVNDINGCIDSAINNIDVKPLPVIGAYPAKVTVCTASTTDLLTGVPAGGVFSGPGVTGTNFDASMVGVGTYTVTYTYDSTNHCSASVQNVITVTVCTGIPDVSTDGDISIYPNPANDMVNVELPDNHTTYSIGLYSLTGQELFETITGNKQNIAIPVSQLSTGVYFLKVTQTDGSMLMRKVEVSK